MLLKIISRCSTGEITNANNAYNEGDWYKHLGLEVKPKFVPYLKDTYKGNAEQNKGYTEGYTEGFWQI